LKSNPPDTSPRQNETPPDVRGAIDRVRDRLGPIARQLHWFDTTSSTNDVAARLAQRGADEGTAVIAESQTAGRGRHGRAWFSPPGAGLYVSVVLRPPPSIGRNENPARLLTLASGVAVAEAVRAVTGLPAEIKWPNDVTVGRRKLAGILAESAAQAGELQFIVLGIGVNLRTAEYPPELAARVTSIEAETSRPAERGIVLAEILSGLNERYSDLRGRRFDAILSAWRRLAVSLPSAPIEWDSPHGVLRGRAEGIDDGGALLVSVDGKVERVVAGEVRWL
jgi:BirA family biotin operon repressor/biotin-[acetyl-CoA-carboxylase] ligase